MCPAFQSYHATSFTSKPSKMTKRSSIFPTRVQMASATYLASSSSTVSATHAFVANFSLVIGTISPDYFITAIQDCYKKRKEQHEIRTEQYIEMSTEMMNLVGASSRTSKGKPS